MRNITTALCCAVTLLMGNAAPNTISWRTESFSPDKKLVALAHTEHTNHGVGGESVWTTVELKRSYSSDEPIDVLEIMDDQTGKEMSLKLSWISASHLSITYQGNRRITFQARKPYGLDVTVEQK